MSFLPTNFRIGSDKVAFVQAVETENYRPAISIATGYTVESTAKLYLSGNPISVFENYAGDKALAIYNIEDDPDTFPVPFISDETYVYEGFRFSYVRTNNNDNIWHPVVAGVGQTEQISTTTWEGIPIGLTGGGRIICRQISGPVSDTRKTMLGGIPLTLVLQGDYWCLAFSNL